MAFTKEIVVTGLGVVSPIGIGRDAVWASLVEGRSGVQRLPMFDAPDLPVPFGGMVANFDPKQYVRPRKSLKVMSRDIQFGFAAADMACQEGGHHEKAIEPERFGIVFGADMIPCDIEELVSTYRDCMNEKGAFDFSRWGSAAMGDLFPLWMLKYLPNMPACHVGIAQDARGPNNSLTLGEVSSLMALAEAVRVIERGQADAVVSGGSGCRIHPTVLFRDVPFQLSRHSDDPAGASRPFDAERDGLVNGEGAAAYLLETKEHSESRGSRPIAKVRSFACAFEPKRFGEALHGTALRQAMREALTQAGLTPKDLGCVVAFGLGTVREDRMEAGAIAEVLGDVPVTVPKSATGFLGAASGALDVTVALLILEHKLIPPTLNYRHRDPSCPITVVHGETTPLRKPNIMILSHAHQGQAIAVILESVN